jgi:hypothetical protein
LTIRLRALNSHLERAEMRRWPQGKRQPGFQREDILQLDEELLLWHFPCGERFYWCQVRASFTCDLRVQFEVELLAAGQNVRQHCKSFFVQQLRHVSLHHLPRREEAARERVPGGAACTRRPSGIAGERRTSCRPARLAWRPGAIGVCAWSGLLSTSPSLFLASTLSTTSSSEPRRRSLRAAQTSFTHYKEKLKT